VLLSQGTQTLSLREKYLLEWSRPRVWLLQTVWSDIRVDRLQLILRIQAAIDADGELRSRLFLVMEVLSDLDSASLAD
jgi:hypothetical protein